MPESGNKSREVSPSRHQGSLAAPNSAARGRTGRPGLLEPYHDIAATFFSVGKGADLDSLFLTAARVCTDTQILSFGEHHMAVASMSELRPSRQFLDPNLYIFKDMTLI